MNTRDLIRMLDRACGDARTDEAPLMIAAALLTIALDIRAIADALTKGAAR
jgi:hypothetical protein